MSKEDFIESPAYDSAARRNNRLLRSVNTVLRRKSAQLRAEADEVIAELFSAPSEADVALERLWREGGFSSELRPENYEELVDFALRAIASYDRVQAAANSDATSSTGN